MRLVRVRPTYFRAFGNSDWIELDSNLVVVFGPNGFGKTSLADAVEWLLYGHTKRRKRGEELSKLDYRGSYVNVHAPAGAETCVTARFRKSDGAEIELKRIHRVVAAQQEISETFVDGTRADFGQIVISADHRFHPIVAQHSLQDFIHAKPKDRRDVISAALGLEVLVRYKTALDKARSRLQATPPRAIVDARTAVVTAGRKMTENVSLITTAFQWTQGEVNPTVDRRELLAEARRLIDDPHADWGNAATRLATMRADTAARIVDTSPLNVAQRIFDETLRQQRALTYANLCAELVTRATVLLQTGAAAYEDALLGLWRTALATRAEHTDTCPVCEEQTLTREKRNELSRRLTASGAYVRAKENLNHSIRDFGGALLLHAADIRDSMPEGLPGDAREKLTSLFPEGSPELQDFLTCFDAAVARRRTIVQQFTQLVVQLDALPAQLTNPEELANARAFVEALQTNADELNAAAFDAANDYQAARRDFEQPLSMRIAGDAAVQELDSVLAPMSAWQSVVILAAYSGLLRETLDLARELEDHLQQKQNQLFQTRGAEIKQWYDRLNPGAAVAYQSMEAGTDTLSLWAQSYGVRMNAVACLSESQLNCLGLGVNFMRVLTPGGPFAFILLDDPVQSMDDDHTQALVADVIQDLLNRDLQVVITSHVQGLADEVWETYFHLPPLRLRISNYQQTGPTIEHAETLQSAINRSRQLAAGNEDSRRLSIKTARRCVELLIRAVCRQTQSPPPPPSGTARNMLPSFSACPGTTQVQAQGLGATVTFTNPGPHTQPNIPVPTEQNILPHLQRLEQIARNLNVW